MSFTTFQVQLSLISLLLLFLSLTAAKPQSHTFMRNEFRPSFSSSEMKALNCDADPSDDSEARFAIQYQSERESLEITEFGYLQIHQRPQPSQGPAVSLVARRTRATAIPTAFILA